MSNTISTAKHIEALYNAGVSDRHIIMLMDDMCYEKTGNAWAFYDGSSCALRGETFEFCDDFGLFSQYVAETAFDLIAIKENMIYGRYY